MLLSFCLVAWLLFKVSYDVHAEGRWLVHAHQYKAEVFAQPQPPNGELKHVQWDGWGFAGSDTTVYLVFNPGGRLTPLPGAGAGRFVGIPCQVFRVRRLERQWYYVVYYTDTMWDYCR